MDTLCRNIAFHLNITRGVEDIKVEYLDGRSEYYHTYAIDWQNPETNHYPKAIDRCTRDLKRVSLCLEKFLVEDASFVTGLSKYLVIECANLIQELRRFSI